MSAVTAPSRSQAWQRRRVPLSIAVPLLVVAALLGVVAGASSETSPRPRAVPAAPPTPVAGGGAAVAIPGGWSRSSASDVPGLPFRHPLTLRRRSDSLQVTIELLPAAARTLLPAGFPAAAPDIVRLDSGQRAWRYAFVPSGSDSTLPAESMLVVWALPTARGVATIACLGRRGTSAPEECERIASSLSTPGSAPLDLGPSAAFWSRLPPVLAALDVARVRGRRALAAAEHAAGQVRAAARLSAAHRSARARLTPLVRAGDGAPSRTVNALRGVAIAYRMLSRTARSRWPEPYKRARESVRAAESDLARALRRARDGARGALAAGRAQADTTR